ncbi:GAF domain nucleotide-binding protein [Thelephora terrestris]|uniref:GAF domain nucleotide-binding protein n=1 Tax=Thelephora terrestris TaxID=56493 RepID=A0A9P6HTE6_9AGAM|nr:GAF domain nucleotide-binding protein [Thelephora terrestris]
MPHADSALVPEGTITRQQFWDHVYEQLIHLLGDERAWVSNLANAASLIYNSLLAFPPFGSGDNAVNWCGFYIHSSYFPNPRNPPHTDHTLSHPDSLLLGPFCGKPACQFINLAPSQARGVCADAFLRKSSTLVPDVEAYPGHIACDGSTKSELVVPLILGNLSGANQIPDTPDGLTAVGVLDLDCLALSGFQEEDRLGMEKIARLITHSCDW